MENFRFFNLHFAFIQFAAVQPEDTDEEIVVCLALVDAIIMTFLRQMHIAKLQLTHQPPAHGGRAMDYRLFLVL